MKTEIHIVSMPPPMLQDKMYPSNHVKRQGLEGLDRVYANSIVHVSPTQGNIDNLRKRRRLLS